MKNSTKIPIQDPVFKAQSEKAVVHSESDDFLGSDTEPEPQPLAKITGDPTSSESDDSFGSDTKPKPQPLAMNAGDPPSSDDSKPEPQPLAKTAGDPPSSNDCESDSPQQKTPFASDSAKIEMRNPGAAKSAKMPAGTGDAVGTKRPASSALEGEKKKKKENEKRNGSANKGSKSTGSKGMTKKLQKTPDKDEKIEVKVVNYALGGKPVDEWLHTDGIKLLDDAVVMEVENELKELQKEEIRISIIRYELVVKHLKMVYDAL